MSSCKQPRLGKTNRCLWSEASELWHLFSWRILPTYPMQCSGVVINFIRGETVFWRMKAFPSSVSPGMWFAANGDSGDSRRPPKISPNTREGNENTTRGEETSITSINAFSSKRIFPLVPRSFHLLCIFSDKTLLWGLILWQICYG